LSILLTDFFRRIPTITGRRKRIKEFIRTYRRQPMTPTGSPAAATKLRQYLDKPPDSIDGDIDRMADRLRLKGVNEVLLTSVLADTELWKNWYRRVIDHRKAERDKYEAARRQGERYRQERSSLDTRLFRSLERLYKLQDVNNLVDREITLIRAWWNVIGA